MKTAFPFRDDAVAEAFDGFPRRARERLMVLRELILETGWTTDGVGPILEALRWGQPAYLTQVTGAGSALRLGVPSPGKVALFAHCRTTLIADFRGHFPDTFDYDGNRAVLLKDTAPVPVAALSHLVRAALTYHLRKKAGRRAGRA